jgi:hypothetical protein
LKPIYDRSNKIPQAATSVRDGKKANRSVISRLLVDELKRPTRDAISVEKILRGADEFTLLIKSGCDLSALSVLLSGIRVMHDKQQQDEDGDHPLKCYMNRKEVFSATEEDPVWQHAMEFRLLCAKVMRKVGPLWRAALILSLSEQLLEAHSGELDYAIEGDVVSAIIFPLHSRSMDTILHNCSFCHYGFYQCQVDESQEELRQGVIERYDTFATALQLVGLVGIWGEKPLLDGVAMKNALPRIPEGPAFRKVMEEQESWITSHPGGGVEFLTKHLTDTFPEYA